MEKEPQPFPTISLVYPPGKKFLSDYVAGVYRQDIAFLKKTSGLNPPQDLLYDLGHPGRDLETFTNLPLNVSELPSISGTGSGEVVMSLPDLLTQLADAAGAFLPTSPLRRGDSNDKQSIEVLRLLAQNTQGKQVKLTLSEVSQGTYILSDLPQTIESH